MRNLALLKYPPTNYEHPHHVTLFEALKENNRDHFHHREGYKDDMPFVCLIKADLSSSNYFFKGHIGGRDDDRKRNFELIDIKFKVAINALNKLVISIESSDRITTYEESIKLVLHSLNGMYGKIDTLGKEGGGGSGKKGYYPASAEKTGRFSTFDKWFLKAVKEKIIPDSMYSSFIEMKYNLIFYKG